MLPSNRFHSSLLNPPEKLLYPPRPPFRRVTCRPSSPGNGDRLPNMASLLRRHATSLISFLPEPVLTLYASDSKPNWTHRRAGHSTITSEWLPRPFPFEFVPSCDSIPRQESTTDERQTPRKEKRLKTSRYLREIDRRQILVRIAQGEKQSALAKEFRVSRAAICNLNKHRVEVLARNFDHPLAKHPKRRLATSTRPNEQDKRSLCQRYRNSSESNRINSVEDLGPLI